MQTNASGSMPRCERKSDRGGAEGIGQAAVGGGEGDRPRAMCCLGSMCRLG